jgi:hypothetical protein
MVRSDTQFIALDRCVPQPEGGRRIWINWDDGNLDPFTRDVSNTAVEGWREYVDFAVVADDEVKWERVWYAKKHKHNDTDMWHEWEEGEDEYAGMIYATTGYGTFTGMAELVSQPGEGYVMVHSRGDRVHSAEEVKSWADDGDVSLTKFHMSERDLAFMPTHEMREACDLVAFVFYGAK